MNTLNSLLSLAFPTLTSTTTLVLFASVLAASLFVVLVLSEAHSGELSVLSGPIRSRATALRERSRRAAFLRLRDPGAPGRSRPRAPGFRSQAA